MLRETGLLAGGRLARRARAGRADLARCSTLRRPRFQPRTRRPAVDQASAAAVAAPPRGARRRPSPPPSGDQAATALTEANGLPFGGLFRRFGAGGRSLGRGPSSMTSDGSCEETVRARRASSLSCGEGTPSRRRSPVEGARSTHGTSHESGGRTAIKHPEAAKATVQRSTAVARSRANHVPATSGLSHGAPRPERPQRTEMGTKNLAGPRRERAPRASIVTAARQDDRRGARAALAAVSLALPAPALAAEPAACLSPDPTAWPTRRLRTSWWRSTTSTSMADPVVEGSVNVTDSCGYGDRRISHGRCALKNTIQAFGGQVNFGTRDVRPKNGGVPHGHVFRSTRLHLQNFTTNVRPRPAPTAAARSQARIRSTRRAGREHPRADAARQLLDAAARR